MSLLQCSDSGPVRGNDADFEVNELGCNVGLALGASLRPAIIDRHSTTLDPVKFTQSCHKCGSPWLKDRGVCTEVADCRHLCRRLSARRHRPSTRSAHEKCYEIPPFHRPSPRQGARRGGWESITSGIEKLFFGSPRKIGPGQLGVWSPDDISQRTQKTPGERN